MTDNITAIIVSYNTADILRSCVESIRLEYPKLKIIIIDGSDETNDCFTYTQTLRDDITLVKNYRQNIGHGPGMNLGIGFCKTRYFLLIDSDVIIRRHGIIEYMAILMDGNRDKCFGVGRVVMVNNDGGNVDKDGIRYLHPHFALIDKMKYILLPAFINHGAPCINTMTQLETSPHRFFCINVPFSDFIFHPGRGTRILNPPEFSPDKWDVPAKQ
jgi:glycosyltransferase involved in cell wall biosynthesis